MEWEWQGSGWNESGKATDEWKRQRNVRKCWPLLLLAFLLLLLKMHQWVLTAGDPHSRNSQSVIYVDVEWRDACSSKERRSRTSGWEAARHHACTASCQRCSRRNRAPQQRSKHAR